MFNKAFLDLDGTVYIDGEVIDNVDKEIRRLKEQGVVFYFVTNNSSVSSSTYLYKLKKLGLVSTSDEIVTPAKVLNRWISQNGYTKLFIVGTYEFISEIETASNILNTDERPEAIIICFDRELNYEKLLVASKLINSGIPYYLTNIDLSCPTASGPIPDCGSIGKLLELATSKPSSGHFGKPGSMMTDFLKSLLGNDDKCLVSGDRLYTDVQLGVELCADSVVLVATGEFDPKYPQEIPEGVIIAPTLASYLRAF
jgi:HAD superfamily hydrolase (TIGR01450 family)